MNKPALVSMGRMGYNMPDWLLTTDSMDEQRRASAAGGSPFLEVTDAFRKQQDNPQLYFELDGHPTPQGNQLMADALRPLLEPLLQGQ